MGRSRSCLRFPAHFVVWTWLLQIMLVPSIAYCRAQTSPGVPNAQEAGVQKAPAPEANWPRTIKSGADTFLIYEPQIEAWVDNRINLYAAVEVKGEADRASSYGVIWFNARTEVDKVNRLMMLEQAQLR